MKYKVAELQGPRLDGAVAKAEGLKFGIETNPIIPPKPVATWVRQQDGTVNWSDGPYMPSTAWATGGPIIERERIMLEPGWKAAEPFDGWNAWAPVRHACVRAPDPLTAAMRAYVASKFGEEVELP